MPAEVSGPREVPQFEGPPVREGLKKATQSPKAAKTSSAAKKPLTERPDTTPKADFGKKQVKTAKIKGREFDVPGFGVVVLKHFESTQLERTLPGSCSVEQLVNECRHELQEGGKTASISLSFSSDKYPRGFDLEFETSDDLSKLMVLSSLQKTLKEAGADVRGSVVISSRENVSEIAFSPQQRHYKEIQMQHPLLTDVSSREAFAEQLSSKLEEFVDVAGVRVQVSVQREGQAPIDTYEDDFPYLQTENINEAQAEMAELLEQAVGKQLHVQLKIESPEKNLVYDYSLESPPKGKQAPQAQQKVSPSHLEEVLPPLLQSPEPSKTHEVQPKKAFEPTRMEFSKNKKLTAEFVDDIQKGHLQKELERRVGRDTTIEIETWVTLDKAKAEKRKISLDFRPLTEENMQEVFAKFRPELTRFLNRQYVSVDITVQDAHKSDA